jgi:hypothetical protein
VRLLRRSPLREVPAELCRLQLDDGAALLEVRDRVTVRGMRLGHAIPGVLPRLVTAPG